MPTPMGVYLVGERVGEIEDHHGRCNEVRAFLGGGPDRHLVGTYPTRREAIAAVEGVGGADIGRSLT